MSLLLLSSSPLFFSSLLFPFCDTYEVISTDERVPILWHEGIETKFAGELIEVLSVLGRFDGLVLPEQEVSKFCVLKFNKRKDW